MNPDSDQDFRICMIAADRILYRFAFKIIPIRYLRKTAFQAVSAVWKTAVRSEKTDFWKRIGITGQNYRSL